MQKAREVSDENPGGLGPLRKPRGPGVFEKGWLGFERRAKLLAAELQRQPIFSRCVAEYPTSLPARRFRIASAEPFAKAKSMQIHLSPRHLRLSASIHAHAAGVVASLEDYTEIFAAHLVLMHDEAAKPPDRFIVKAHLAIRGPDVHAESKAETLHVALDRTGDKLARQLRKRKTKLTDKRRSKLQKQRERARR